MPSASNERQVRARDRQSLKDRETEVEVISALMQHVNGRRWVWLRIAEAGIFSEDQDLDAMRLAYVKGRRNEALRLLNLVSRYCPDMYIQMTNEAQAIEAAITKKDPNYVGSADDD